LISIPIYCILFVCCCDLDRGVHITLYMA